MYYSTWVEVNCDALAGNVRSLREMVGEGRRILMVVKADAYGHGAVEIARQAGALGVHFLGVATLHEGIEIRRAGVDLPILILSPSLPAEAPAIVEHGLRASVSGAALGEAIAAAGRARATAHPVHLEVDTGMGRAGLPPGEAFELALRLSRLPGIALEGVFTHFPCADRAESDATRGQAARFRELLERLRRAGVAVPLAHAANSDAILGEPDTWMDMVRPGLLLYGIATTAGGALPPGFRPVMSFRTRVLHLRELRAGQSVSYGSTWTASRPTTVATVGAGYGHGYPWKLSNRGEVLLRGVRAPVIGRVTMDLTMVDATGIPGVEVGDEVVLFGSQGGETLPVGEVAARAETLAYEVICGLGKRVVRAYVSQGRAGKALTLVGEEAF